jgi:hypothetical protein
LSDLEFQRELRPEQMREALSLLDNTAGTQNQTVQIEDLRPAEEVNPEPDQSSTTMPTQGSASCGRRPAAAAEASELSCRLFWYWHCGRRRSGALVMVGKCASTANAKDRSRAVLETVGSAGREKRFPCATGCRAST